MATQAYFLKNIADRLARTEVLESRPCPPEDAQRISVAPPIPTQDRIERFVAEARLIGAKVTVFDSVTTAMEALAGLIAGTPPQAIGSWSFAAMSPWPLQELAGASDWLTPEADSFLQEAPRLEIGITGVDYAIAGTGTLVLQCDPLKPRSISLTPRLHVALVEEKQIAPAMGDAISFIRRADATPSAVQFITGPSRSADIENDLSIGVHGPTEVHIFIVRAGD